MATPSGVALKRIFRGIGVTDIQKEREAFECEFKQTDYYIAHGDLSTLMLCDDQYALDDVQVSFEMWQAAKAQAVLEWISVKDKLPPENILVLGMSQTPRNIFNIYNVMALDEFEEADVTHWMPLPDAPQEPAND